MQNFLQRRLKPGCEQWLARLAGRLGFTMEMREDGFMGKQRGPFKSSGSVTVRTANQFMLAIGKFYEFGGTKLPNEFGVIA